MKVVNIMLGKLKKIEDLRSVWKHEALDFTKWLAKEENLYLLGEEIGIEITLIETEASVGGFNVDILAEEESTGKKIIIENQLENSDHDHLGKVLTYASGYDAEIIIWLLKDIRDEHLQAVTWLNENTNDMINFFVIKIELWEIDDSPIAVKFNVVARPNDWTRSLRKSVQEKCSETQLLQLNYWNALKEYVSIEGSVLKLRKPRPRQWFNIACGISGSYIGLTVNSQQNIIAVELYIGNSKELYQTFLDNKNQIENQIGESLEWMELPTKKASRIKLSNKADFKDENDWERQFEWIKKYAEIFADVFKNYID